MGARDIAGHRFMKPIEFAAGAHVADDPSWAQPLVLALLAGSGVEIEEGPPEFKAFERFVYKA